MGGIWQQTLVTYDLRVLPKIMKLESQNMCRGRDVKIMTQVPQMSKPPYPQDSFICEMPWNSD
jgi:hypothetical protein